MDHYYYDYDEDEAEEDILDEYHYEQLPEYLDEETRSFGDVYRTCVAPSVIQIAGYVCALLGCSLLCRFLWTISRRLQTRSEWLQHLTSVLCGFGVLYLTTGHEFLIVLFLCLLAYVLMLLAEYFNCRYTGVLMALFTVSCHLLFEISWKRPEAWQRIRGIQMVATMKIISLAFDIETISAGEKNKYATVPALVPYLGYLFCPATCVLGPWVPYNAYIFSMRTKFRVRSLLWSMLNASLAISFLVLSNCIVPMLWSDETRSKKWFRAYKDALSVRCSHYFICFLSQMTLAAMGASWRIDGATSNALLGPMVTRPWNIEFPRSLSSLVRSWNIPMHDWLKKYVFRTTRNRCNYFTALLITYLFSSLLHGLHLKVYAVLLSLGIFAYVESVFRAKLAVIFGACITSNSCRKPCQFTHCSSKRGWNSSSTYFVLLFNMIFMFITVLHLAYLGIVMNSANAEETDDNLSITSGLLWQQWAGLDFLSHWIVVTFYVFYCLI